MIESVRKHMARILRTLEADAFQRKVNHSEAGPLTLEKLLTNITNHVPHHVKFIEEKRAALRRANLGMSAAGSVMASGPTTFGKRNDGILLNCWGPVNSHPRVLFRCDTSLFQDIFANDPLCY